MPGVAAHNVLIRAAGLTCFLALHTYAQTVCGTCHRAVYDSYLRTAMGRSFATPARASAVEHYAAKNRFYHAPSETYFEVIERGGRYYQRRYQTGYDGRETNVDETTVDYAMGSGDHARAYLHRTERGVLVQLPVAWYAEDGGHWGMAPGYDSADHPYSRREITYACIFCHNAYPNVPPGSKLRDEPVFPADLPQGIDCQRCHGPGERHVRAAQRAGATLDEIRKAIVNPARLDRDRQLEVCMQCHLETTSRHLPDSILQYGREPFSYTPGEPLGNFMLYFDRAPGSRFGDDFEIDHSAYRLRKSQCFLQSKGALVCTTCHNPHASSANYNAVCGGCHTSLRAHTTDGNCVGCHMPKRRTSDVVHVVMTDHLIQRRPPASPIAPLAERDEAGVNRYQGEVVPYYGEPGELYLAVAQVRDKSNLKQGIARLKRAVDAAKPERQEPWFELADALASDRQLEAAIAMYAESLRRDPSHLASLIGLGAALHDSGHRPEALNALARAAQAAPRDPRAWNALGTMQLESGNTAVARTALEKAILLDPEMPEAHNGLGIVFSQIGDWPAAENQFREAIRAVPNYVKAHSNLGNLLVQDGDLPQAAWEFAAAVRLKPADAAARFNYAVALNDLRRYSEAREQMEASVRLNGNVAEAHEILAGLLTREGRTAESRRERETAARLRANQNWVSPRPR